ncbi:hypothetical protein [Phaeobacter porticola]|uniref:hypothetical protein n=1 Tax=Phaeobacter porticola TaxID=1844006 RepID=UPI000930205A|nr:hypothetical protein [Phaeobacter porticola]
MGLGAGKIAWARIISLVGLLVLSIVSGYFLQPLVSGNKDAINTIVTIFSILAGFLIAVITFIGDPGLRGWKELQLDKRSAQAKLSRHRMLFHLYLLTLALALAMFLVPETYITTQLWLERFFVGSATFVFLASFSLPRSLSALQMERYETALAEQLPDFLKEQGTTGEK